MKTNLTMLDWAKWAVATVIAAITMTTAVIAGVYRTFTPRDLFEQVITRLDRIETKLDNLAN